MTRTVILSVVLATISLGILGCGNGGRPEGMPKLYPLTLTFTQDGVPLAGANVMLNGATPDLQRWGAGGMTDESGKVSFTTLGRYPGVAAGKFKVVVEKTERDAPIAVPPGGEMTQEQLVADAQRKTYDLVDPKYGDSNTTDLEVDTGSRLSSKTFEIGKAVRKAR